MPELPEVETVRRGLAARGVGQVFAQATVGHPGILEDCTPLDLATLQGDRLERCDRHGKYLLLRLRGNSRDRTLVVHLGMSGQFTFRHAHEDVVEGTRRMPSGYVKTLGPPPVDAHTHLVLRCRDGGEFLFRDPRRFGRILLLDGWETATHPRLERLGPDAVSLDAASLSGRLAHGGRRDVKSVLLDQSVVAGIGNIYADEACFAARIRPDRAMESLSARSRMALAQAVIAVLEQGIQMAGTTFRDFVDVDGAQGGNAERLQVYARGGAPCLRCGKALHKAVVATRGTVWCPRCQR
ncbi:MAG TPA: bifunctional DNA-formamidopyrimidine glycosylase/DNA-(apurinic or apyrimidinic site) lyase [Fibrobacteria bacterium]|nr:bifunctional DNA-formamidopyrimidine glycosylase/DNA-(apurinic or apyrimidinic site) lyase [Fibrobacteria bacterium]HOX51707.1 bifunctional DNA-formamidopyrimidine glycosylase/DNA-(apurinic or apyrimidinic site) lyase [Fibrobacteria bacterium]